MAAFLRQLYIFRTMFFRIRIENDFFVVKYHWTWELEWRLATSQNDFWLSSIKWTWLYTVRHILPIEWLRDIILKGLGFLTSILCVYSGILCCIQHDCVCTFLTLINLIHQQWFRPYWLIFFQQILTSNRYLLHSIQFCVDGVFPLIPFNVMRIMDWCVSWKLCS